MPSDGKVEESGLGKEKSSSFGDRPGQMPGRSWARQLGRELDHTDVLIRGSVLSFTLSQGVGLGE